MSLWSKINAKVSIHESKNVSVESVIDVWFDECVFNIKQTKENDCFIYDINISFSESGRYASEVSNEFVFQMESRGAKFNELEITVRWY